MSSLFKGKKKKVFSIDKWDNNNIQEPYVRMLCSYVTSVCSKSTAGVKNFGMVHSPAGVISEAGVSIWVCARGGFNFPTAQVQGSTGHVVFLCVHVVT